MQDLLEDTNEIQDLLSRSFSLGIEVDEADLDAGMECTTYRFFFRPPQRMLEVVEMRSIFTKRYA
jgi:hypothetical protein